jgi:formamidopyrimidine-DNA glycosylase
MPELPEVEVLARRLRPLLRGKTIRSVSVSRPRATRPTHPAELQKALVGATFGNVLRRGKYFLFELHVKKSKKPLTVLGHLGMTGRMFLALKKEKMPKHAAIVFDLGSHNFVYEDWRYFGRMSLDLSPIEALGPEPEDLKPEAFTQSLKNSRQPIKVKLLDQSLIAGVGNIYASEALYLARISPKLPANRLTLAQARELLRAIRAILKEAIKFGSTVPLKVESDKAGALFYFSEESGGFTAERLRVYDRAGKPCLRCGTEIERIIQAARSTFFCPHCQRLH